MFFPSAHTLETTACTTLILKHRVCSELEQSDTKDSAEISMKYQVSSRAPESILLDYGTCACDGAATVALPRLRVGVFAQLFRAHERRWIGTEYHRLRACRDLSRSFSDGRLAEQIRTPGTDAPDRWRGASAASSVPMCARGNMVI